MNYSEYFIGLACYSATKSKDPRCQVGTAIADRHNALVSTGFNGFPIGIHEGAHWHSDKKYSRVIHAEINGLIFADRNRLKDATLYVTKAPCDRCAAVIVQHHRLYGPLTVVCPPPEVGSKWFDSQLEGQQMFAEAGLSCIHREFNEEKRNACPLVDHAIPEANHGLGAYTRRGFAGVLDYLGSRLSSMTIILTYIMVLGLLAYLLSLVFGFDDPAKGCKRYQKGECSHIESLLCDYPNCDKLKNEADQNHH